MNEDLRYSKIHLGKFFRMLRIRLGYTLRGLAREAGISNPHILRMEEGKADFTLWNFVKLASALGIPPGWAIDHATFSTEAYFRDRLIDCQSLRPLYRRLGATGQGARHHVAGFIGAACSVAAQLTRSSNPEVTLLRVPNNGGLSREWFGPLIVRLKETISPADNIALLRALREDGYSELIKLGVLSEEKVYGALSYTISRYGQELNKPIDKIATTELLPEYGPFFPDFPSHPELKYHFRFTSNEKHVSRREMLLTPTSISELMARVAFVTKARGERAKLAKIIKVPPQRLNDWIHGRNIPNGQMTLHLQNWVIAEEAKTNQQKSNPGRADTRPGRKTRKRKITSNEKPKSSQR